MRKRGLVGTLIAVILVITLAVAAAATYLTLRYFVIVNWQLYPRNEQMLDLRNRAITLDEYDTLSWQLPNTKILWSVPFAGGYVSSDTETVTVTTLTDADVDAVVYLPQLKTVQAGSCTDYPALLTLYKAYPEIQVNYTVPVAGQKYGPDTASISIQSLNDTDVAMMAYLPHLRSVDGTHCRDYDTMEQVQKSHPEWNLVYTTSIAGQAFEPSATTLEVTGASYEELSFGLAAMKNLKSVTLHDPDADAESLLKLREEYPGITIHWDMNIFGNVYGDETAELDISNQPVGSVEVAKEYASRFPNLTKLIVDSNGIEDEEMAAFREEMRSQYKVVWTVYFSSLCKARTDETYFMPIKQGEYYFQECHVFPLRYCEDMVCIDLGHSTIKTVDFAAYMPHLKYLILAWTQVTDITPLSHCKELVYLELDHGIVHDFTPLQGCTALEDLNINDQQVKVSIEPLKEMPWLKTLWVPDRKYNEKIELTEALPDTRVVTYEMGSSTGMGWRNLKNYYDMRDYLGMYYMN